MVICVGYITTTVILEEEEEETDPTDTHMGEGGGKMQDGATKESENKNKLYYIPTTSMRRFGKNFKRFPLEKVSSAKKFGSLVQKTCDLFKKKYSNNNSNHSLTCRLSPQAKGRRKRKRKRRQRE